MSGLLAIGLLEDYGLDLSTDPITHFQMFSN